MFRKSQKLNKRGCFFDPITITAIGLGISALAGGAAFVQQQEVTKQAKKAEGLRKEQMKLSAARERRKEIRQMLLQRASIVNSAANQGALGSSSQVGGAGSAVATGSQNIRNINQSEAIGSQLFDTNEAQAQARGNAGNAQAVSGFGFSLAQNAGPASRSLNQLFGVG